MALVVSNHLSEMAQTLELGNRLNVHLTALPAPFLCFQEK